VGKVGLLTLIYNQKSYLENDIFVK